MRSATGPAASPGVSIVIPHYGDHLPTLALIDLLRGQDHEGPLQVIVSDDCSPEPFPLGGADVVHRASRNRGFGSTVNAGVRHAVHQLLLILNSDLEPGPDFVRSLVGAALPHLPAICAPLLVEPGGSGGTAYKWPTAQIQTVGSLMPMARFADRSWFSPWIMSWPGALPGATCRPDWVAGACVLLRTEDFRAVGGFDEAFYMYGEDTDLCARLAGAGIPSVFLGTVEIGHGHGGSSDPERIGRWNAHARFRYAAKQGFRRRLGAGLAGVMVVNFGYNVARRALGKEVRPVERLKYDWGLLTYGWSGRDPRQA